MADYEPIPNSNGMSVLRNVVDLETGERRDVGIRNITEAGMLALTKLILQTSAIEFALLGRLAQEKPLLLQSSFVCYF